MDIPDLVRERLGDEEITAGVSIGDEDAVCLTPTRTLIYRGEGLLSDEDVQEFDHDVERLAVKEGRRKTKFILEYVEGPESFTVPENRGDKVLELLLQGILRHEDVIDRRESIAGVYRFTELTLVITEQRILKHIGSHVWDDDFETYPFADVTGVDFERASNATSISIEVDGRPQRVKVPNDTARLVRQTLEEVLFDYYDVTSLEEFNQVVGDRSADAAESAAEETDEGSATDDIGFEEGIDPLVTDSADEELDDVSEAPEPDHGSGSEESAVPEKMDVSFDARTDSAESEAEAGESSEAGSAETDSSGTTGSAAAGESETASEMESPAETEAASQSSTETEAASQSPIETQAATETSAESAETSVESAGTAETNEQMTDAAAEASASESESATTGAGTEEQAATGTVPQQVELELDYEPASQDDLAAVATQVEELTEAVERQNELLKRQHKAIKQLVTELRSE